MVVSAAEAAKPCVQKWEERKIAALVCHVITVLVHVLQLVVCLTFPVGQFGVPHAVNAILQCISKYVFMNSVSESKFIMLPTAEDLLLPLASHSSPPALVSVLTFLWSVGS